MIIENRTRLIGLQKKRGQRTAANTVGICLLVSSFCTAPSAFAEGKTPLYTSETPEGDVDDALNRISGKYDNGFSQSDQTYKPAKSRASAVGRRDPASLGNNP